MMIRSNCSTGCKSFVEIFDNNHTFPALSTFLEVTEIDFVISVSMCMSCAFEQGIEREIISFTRGISG